MFTFKDAELPLQLQPLYVNWWNT